MKSLIRRFAVLLCTAFVTVAVMTGTIIASAENMTLTAHDVVKDITVGWNLGNALDCYESPEFGADGMASEELWGNPPVARELISEVKKAGFNAIRIPITWYNHMDKSSGKIDPAWMNRVKTVVDYAMDEGFYTIINVHHDTGEKGWLHAGGANYEENKELFVSIWKQICEIFRDYSDKLMFEGYNEILDDDNTWDEPDEKAFDVANELNQVFVDTVRASGGNNQRTMRSAAPHDKQL